MLGARSDEDFRNLPRGVQEIRKVLGAFFSEMQEGKIEGRKPDPFYPVAIPAANVRKVMAQLDADLAAEIARFPDFNKGYVPGPCFQNLPFEQQLALAQELHSIKEKYQGQF